MEGVAVRKLIVVVSVTGSLLLGIAGAAIADHQAGPCNDSDGDGAFSGREYAQHHVMTGAHDGIIGQVHKPGSHKGFSACNPSGR